MKKLIFFKYMKFGSFSLTIGFFSLGATLFILESVQAAPEVFTIDSSQSQITISGAVAGYPFSAQGAESTTTTYSGNINADVSGSTIQFTGSSAIIAGTNGIWLPGAGGAGDAAAADYGVQASIPFFGTAYGAARNIVLDLTSASLPLNETNFDSSALIFSFATGSSASLDYNAILTSGSLSLGGNATNTVANGASLVTEGSTQKLVIQFNSQFSFTLLSDNDTPLTLTGQIVATNSSAAPFMFNSIVLTNRSVVLSLNNATMQSQLQSSTNLENWSPISGNTSSNAGVVTFTVPISGPKMYFRAQK